MVQNEEFKTDDIKLTPKLQKLLNYLGKMVKMNLDTEYIAMVYRLRNFHKIQKAILIMTSNRPQYIHMKSQHITNTANQKNLS